MAKGLSWCCKNSRCCCSGERRKVFPNRNNERVSEILLEERRREGKKTDCGKKTAPSHQHEMRPFGETKGENAGGECPCGRQARGLERFNRRGRRISVREDRNKKKLESEGKNGQHAREKKEGRRKFCLKKDDTGTCMPIWRRTPRKSEELRKKRRERGNEDFFAGKKSMKRTRWTEASIIAANGEEGRPELSGSGEGGF